jgi:hypothetical protein
MLAPDLEVEESVHRADQALLLAKAAGRNRVIDWDPAITTATLVRQLVEGGAPG